MANPKDPAKPVARSPGFWENLMSPKPKGPATSLRNATHMTQQVVPTAAAAADAALNASTSARHGGRAQLPGPIILARPSPCSTAPGSAAATSATGPRSWPRRRGSMLPPSPRRRRRGEEAALAAHHSFWLCASVASFSEPRSRKICQFHHDTSLHCSCSNDETSDSK